MASELGSGDDWATRDVHALERELGTSLENGIALDTFQERQAAWGANVVRAGSQCPKVLCCLLPCLRLDATRRRIQREGPDYAVCVRSGRRFDVVAAELVPGDVVELDSSYRVPADCRILSASEDFQLAPGALDASAAAAGGIEAGSGGVALQAAVVRQGSARALVVRTGNRTAWAKSLGV